MINSKELLQKFSRRLGIPESEGRLSLEIFAKLISQKLGFGDEVEIEALGYFAYKKVKPVHSESDEYQKIILFSEEKISGQNKNFLLFFLPDDSKKEFPHIDSYLNLSFGKPLITSEKIAESEFILSTSNNEMISLIESKAEKLFSEAIIYRNTEIAQQEFIEPDNVTSLEESVSEDEKNAKWIFDDLTIEDDMGTNNELKSDVTINGYSEVKDPFSKKTTITDSRNQNNNFKKPLDVSLGLKPKKNIMRKLVPALVGLLIIGAAAAGVYLNYDKIKSMVFRDGSNISQTVVAKKRIEPVVIDRTFEIPVTYPYKLEKENVDQIPDSLIINPAVFIRKHTLQA